MEPESENIPSAINQTPIKNTDKVEGKQKEKEEAVDQSTEQLIFTKLNDFFDQYFLGGLHRAAMIKFLKTHLSNKTNDTIPHIRPWLLSKINGIPVRSQQEWQKGCPDIIPGLKAQPWWDATEFSWIKNFEENYKVIRDQLMLLRGQKGFQPYRGPSWISDKKAKDGVGNESVDQGTWNVFYLELHNIKFNANCEKVPKTMELIEKYLPNNYHHCFFSALTEKSHILKHHGPTNKKLRFHLPLMGVKGSRLRVADHTKQQQQGKAYVFDDSFEHEAWHDGDETRLILIADFWHPDLTQNQLKLLRTLQNSRFRAEAKYSELDEDKDNFYSIIENAKELIKDNEWWVVKEGEHEQKQAQQHSS